LAVSFMGLTLSRAATDDLPATIVVAANDKRITEGKFWMRRAS